MTPVIRSANEAPVLRNAPEVETRTIPVAGLCNHFRRRVRIGYVVATAAASPLLAGSAIAAPLFTMTEILAPVNGSEVRGRDINNSGQGAGSMAYDFGSFTTNRAFVWAGSGTAQDVGTLGSNTVNHARSEGYAINSSGQVTGWSQTSGSGEQSFLFSGGSISSIDTASNSSNAYGMNNLGQITGVRNNHAYFYNGSMLQVGTLTGGTFSIGQGINDNGTIVGYGNVTGGIQHAFVYSSGVMTDIGMLPGASNGSAIAVNNSGLVAGTSTVGGADHGFLYSGTTMTDLGVGTAMDINASGQVVMGAGVSGHAMFYDGGTAYDLNTLIDPLDPLFGSVVLRGANGINDMGQIVATTFALGAPGSGVRTFVLTPEDVPEPASVLILGCGLAGLVRARGMRNRARSS